MFKYMYIKYNDLISICQSGFQPGVSTINQLVEIYDKTYDKIVTSSDKGKYIRFFFVIFLKHLIEFGIKVLFINLRDYILGKYIMLDKR